MPNSKAAESALAWVRERAKPAEVEFLEISPEDAAEDGIEPGRYGAERIFFRGRVPPHMRKVLSSAKEEHTPLSNEAIRFGNTGSTWNYLEYTFTRYSLVRD